HVDSRFLNYQVGKESYKELRQCRQQSSKLLLRDVLEVWLSFWQTCTELFPLALLLRRISSSLHCRHHLQPNHVGALLFFLSKWATFGLFVSLVRVEVE